MLRKSTLILLVVSSFFIMVASVVHAQDVNGSVTGVEKAQFSFFYQTIEAPAWKDQAGNLNTKGQALISVLQTADQHGLKPSDYGVTAYQSYTDKLLTKAALRYIHDLNAGRIAPKEIDSELYIYPRAVEAGRVLVEIYNSRDLSKAFERLAPGYPEYRFLKKKLAQFRELEKAGGWPVLSASQTLRPGDKGEEIVILRKRLAAQNYLSKNEPDSPVFDDEVRKAIENFQHHHGLNPDGYVGPKTRAALNVPVSERIGQIIINMERWRWLPDDLGKRHMRINIPGFHLKVFEGHDAKIEMPVIVGKPYRKTPVFSTVMTDVIFNPYWHVPVNIAFSHIIPEIIKDPGYLDRQGFEVLQYGEDGQLRSVNSPNDLLWSSFSKGSFPYLLRQKPGIINALGHVRFSIKNNMSIYLHGTPNHGLFAQQERARSSGCIRVENPLGLLKYVLRGNTAWPESKIEELYYRHEQTEHLKPQMVPLKEQIPVHIVYWTAWVKDDDYIYFSEDVYGRDKILFDVLS